MELEKKVKHSIWEFIFYSNFFMGLMSIALNFETNIKTDLPLNSIKYYLFISSLSILFYLFAYNVPKKYNTASNHRTKFYIDFRKPIKLFNIITFLIVLFSGSLILFQSFDKIIQLHFSHYIVLFATLVLCTSYYNWKFGFSLRRFTWLKPILIAWTWAITTVYLPILMLEVENGIPFNVDARFYFLFTQTFMYFIVNAIIFDMKDFEDDTNRGLKTFVVKLGIDATLNRIIFPLIALGFLSFISFGIWYNLPLHRILFMLIPITLMAVFAYRLHRPKSILYYLMAIDGMIVVKAIFGILSVILFE